MTSYDPFSFGQVSLDGKPGAPGQGSPDDLLFADAGPVRQAAPADAGWGIGAPSPGGEGVAEAGSGLAQFGAEILGESPRGPAAGLDAPAPAPRPKPASSPRPAPVPAAGSVLSPNAAPPRRASPLLPPANPAVGETARLAAAAAKAAAKPALRRLPVEPLVQRASPFLRIVVPAMVIAAGGTAVSWCWFLQGNPVMACLLGALAVVGAALVRVAVRA